MVGHKNPFKRDGEGSDDSVPVVDTGDIHSRAQMGFRIELGTLREAVKPVLAGLGPCRFDHSGNCQAHFLERPCSVEVLRLIMAHEGKSSR